MATPPTSPPPPTSSTPPTDPPQSELFGPCGMYCGFCMSYLAKKHQVPRRKGMISYCDGCRPRDKQCSFLKKRCHRHLDHEVDFCNQCPDYSCAPLDKLELGYTTKAHFPYSFKTALAMIQTHGADYTAEFIRKEHHCEQCGEVLCIHNGLCFHCDKAILATMKNYRNAV